MPFVSGGLAQDTGPILSLPLDRSAAGVATDMLNLARRAGQTNNLDDAQRLVSAHSWSAVLVPLIWAAADADAGVLSPVVSWLTQAAHHCYVASPTDGSELHGTSIVVASFTSLRNGMRARGIADHRGLIVWYQAASGEQLRLHAPGCAGKIC